MALLIPGVLSSDGDRDIIFQECIKSCLKHENQSLPFYLELFQWNKDCNCKYECMHEISQKRKLANLPIMQYYGKWPFKRLYGIEDPASFWFSLLNLIGNVIGWVRYCGSVDKYSEFYSLTKTQFLVNINGWMSACLFHTRDLYWTEKLDYFSAALIIAISIFTCFSRIIGRLHDLRTYLFGIAVILLFAYHISYMALVNFDYGYNMKFMICIGALNVLSWLLWCGLYQKERKHVWKCAVTMGGTGVLALLELLDFPPVWWIFDGHSLWHLGTAPLSLLWFSFLIDDDNFIRVKYYKLI